jgi:hypothetical protein
MIHREIFNAVRDAVLGALDDTYRDEWYSTSRRVATTLFEEAEAKLFSEQIREDQERALLAQLKAKYEEAP